MGETVGETMDERPKASRRLAWGAAVTLLCAVAAGAWWLRGRPVYTDGQSIQVSGYETTPREVLWTAPRLLAIDFSPSEQQYEPSLSPDGTELYFVRGKPGHGADIFVSYRRDNQWTRPEALASVNSSADELGPRVSPDGKLLYFYSDRPGGAGGYDLWAAPREAGGWGEPFNLGHGVNTEFNEMNPDPAPDGRRLIFSTDRKAASREQVQAWRGTIRRTGTGDYDLWMATIDPPDAATRPAAGGPVFRVVGEIPGVNTDFVEGASCMSQAGDFLYFASNRPGGLGKFDLYRCRVRDDEFGPVENLGPTVNSPDNDADPALSMGGFRLVFSSDRGRLDGVYALLGSDSREVFAQREARDLPRLGWSTWSLVASVILLLPLILALRGAPGRLGTLQRCLIASLLVHVLLTFALSFVLVTQEVTRYVRHQIAGDVAVNLNLPKDVEIGVAVRGQYSSDVPVAAAEPGAVARTVTDELRPAAFTGVRTNTPAAQAFAVVDAPTAPKPAVTPASPPAATVEPDVTAAVSPLQGISPRAITAKAAQVTPHVVVAEVATATKRHDPAADAAAWSIAVAADTIPKAVPFIGDVGVAGPIAVRGDPPREVIGPARGTMEVRPAEGTEIAAVPAAAPANVSAARLAPTGSAPVLVAAEPQAVVSRLRTAGATSVEGAPRQQVLSGTAPAQATPLPLALDSGVKPRPIGPGGDVAASATPALADAFVAESPLSTPVMTPARQTRAVGGASESELRGTEVAARSSSRATAADAPATRPALPANVMLAASPGPLQNGPGVNEVSLPTSPVHELPAPPAAAPDVITNAVAPPDFAAPAPLARDVIARSRAVASADQALAPSEVVRASSRFDGDRSRPSSAAPAPATLRVDSGGPSPAGRDSMAAARPADLVPSVIGGTAVNVEPAVSPAPVSVAGATGPESPFPRSPEQRQPRIEQQGGTRESESAVDRGLAYLARQQEPDGRWTIALDDGPPGRRPMSPHDMACTGLAVLAMLARDNTPDKPGPYRQAVASGLDYLLAMQDENGDLRGEPRLRGAGSGRGGMYDHAIATLALAEAALMTKDQRYAAAAMRGTIFIIASQDGRSGGWRYAPGEYGDSSVFGWQIMALHATEQLGLETPEATRTLADGYLRLVAQGPRGMLAGYQPGRSPSPAMTAEVLYARMLLGQQIGDDDLEEATAFLARQPPSLREPNLYYWYYASLCMLQAKGEQWKHWNALTREALIALQKHGGRGDGGWDADLRYGKAGGRIYTTALAVLTLEVYYRYLPLRQ